MVTHWDTDPVIAQETSILISLSGRGVVAVPVGRDYLVYCTRRETRGGNMFRAWRRCEWSGLGLPIVVRQERNFFGSSIEARMPGYAPEQVSALREVFAEVDVELIVEP